MRNFTNQYFTKKERRSLFLMALLIFFGTAAMYIVYHFDKPDSYRMEDLLGHAIMDSIHQVTSNVEDKKLSMKAHSSKYKQRQFKKFDPNTITVEELMAMGVSKYASSNLQKYRQKGGRINSKSHFFKIYGMEKFAAMLDSLIQFNEAFSESDRIGNKSMAGTNADISTAKDSSSRKTMNGSRANTIPTVKLKVIELNTADSFELESIRGIGPYLAARIVRYRNKLGGFYDVDQLEEVYGMRAETYMEINHLVKANTDLIAKLKINNVDEKALAAHPYIGKKAASILMRYKKQHGNFQSVEDVMKVRIYDEEEIQRLKWYLDFN